MRSPEISQFLRNAVSITDREELMKNQRCPNTFRLSTLSRILLFFFFASVSLLSGGMAAAEQPANGNTPQEILPVDALMEENTQQSSGRTNFVANLDVFYTHTDEVDSDSLSGGGFNGLLGMGARMTDRSTFLLMYTGNYNSSLDFYTDLVGPRRRTEYQSHTITPMLKFDFGENNRYSLSPSIFYTSTYNKDVDGGSWDDGLYNYRDIGADLDFKAKGMGYGGKDGLLMLGMQYYNREYPNYVSLLDLATGIGIEEDERDYDGLLGRIGYTWGYNIGFSWSADYYLLFRKLEGKKVVGPEGVLTTEGQEDYLHNMELWFWYVPDTQPGLRFGLALNGRMSRGNQNYYDGLGTTLPIDDVFIHDFYDFNSYGIRPSLSYLLPMTPLTTSISYTYQKTDYPDRLAQDSLGNYKNEELEETQNGANLRLFYDLSISLNVPPRWQVGIYGRYQYLKVRSNNDNESVYRYNRELHEFTAGLSFRY